MPMTFPAREWQVSTGRHTISEGLSRRALKQKAVEGHLLFLSDGVNEAGIGLAKM